MSTANNTCWGIDDVFYDVTTLSTEEARALVAFAPIDPKISLAKQAALFCTDKTMKLPMKEFERAMNAKGLSDAVKKACVKRRRRYQNRINSRTRRARNAENDGRKVVTRDQCDTVNVRRQMDLDELTDEQRRERAEERKKEKSRAAQKRFMDKKRAERQMGHVQARSAQDDEILQILAQPSMLATQPSSITLPNAHMFDDILWGLSSTALDGTPLNDSEMEASLFLF